METNAADLDISKYIKLKVPELKKELKSRGLSTSGNKVDLIERLQSDMLKSKSDDTTSAESIEDLDEDLLNDDDDESILNDVDSPSDSKPLKRKSTDEPVKLKKVILVRKHCDVSSSGIEDENKDGKDGRKIVLHRNRDLSDGDEKIKPDSEDGGKSERKIIKLSELTEKERLEMRAKKFGLPLSGDAKKIARAERFGSTKTSSISLKAPAASADVLKQRAERFGITAPTKSLNKDEKLEKRKERFGSAANGHTASAKAQQRIEGFKN